MHKQYELKDEDFSAVLCVWMGMSSISGIKGHEGVPDLTSIIS